MGNKAKEEKLLISYCGICCSLCPLYRKGECPGCPAHLDCKIVQCAKKKGERYCFACNEFPCKLFEKGFDWSEYNIKDWKPYDQKIIEMFKRNKFGKLIKKQNNKNLGRS